MGLGARRRGARSTKGGTPAKGGSFPRSQPSGKRPGRDGWASKARDREFSRTGSPHPFFSPSPGGGGGGSSDLEGLQKGGSPGRPSCHLTGKHSDGSRARGIQGAVLKPRGGAGRRGATYISSTRHSVARAFTLTGDQSPNPKRRVFISTNRLGQVGEDLSAVRAQALMASAQGERGDAHSGPAGIGQPPPHRPKNHSSGGGPFSHRGGLKVRFSRRGGGGPGLFRGSFESIVRAHNHGEWNGLTTNGGNPRFPEKKNLGPPAGSGGT